MVTQMSIQDVARPSCLRSILFAVALVLAAGALTPSWAQTPCTPADNGSGTVDLPPPGCGYVSPDDLHMMINGLPPGTTINIDPIHRQFTNVTQTPGGSLGGNIEVFDSVLFITMQGTGLFAGYKRILQIDLHAETHTGPRVLGVPYQSFPNEMVNLQGQLFPGDPDFDLLRFTAGSANGLPASTGHTVLTEMDNGNWNVDSFFDIFYEIEFVGAPGGIFNGMSGTTQGEVRMQAGTPAPEPPPCTVVDNGTGTIDLPPAGCTYVSPQELHQMIDGLPPGTPIRVGAAHQRFFNTSSLPGGSLGGNIEFFSSELELRLEGAGVSRVISLPVDCETHTAERALGDSVQSFDTDMFRLQGQIIGDPDFDLLRVTGGTFHGMPSPGHTTLTRVSPAEFNVDSFFDITYRIDFIGAPGGPLAGMSGSTTATVKMKTGTPKTTFPPCFSPDNGGGTVNLPPASCAYLSPDDVHQIINGLPPGTEITLGAQHARFFNVVRTPGGSLGGEVEQFNSQITLNLKGEGLFPGLSRILTMPLQCVAHTGPRTPFSPVQSFPTLMFGMQGQLPPGDPDFDLLRIEVGTPFGLPPSPGHTTLTQAGPGQWQVDSFFDITYRIDFQGSSSGHLQGAGGSTTGTIRMQAAPEILPPLGTPGLTLHKFPGAALLEWTQIPFATEYDVVCGDLQALRSSNGSFVVATDTCLEDGQPTTSTPHAPVPPPGEGTWCVVRGTNIAGFGTYNEGGAQMGTRDGGIAASGMGCP